MEILLCLCLGIWNDCSVRSWSQFAFQALWIHWHPNWNLCNHYVSNGSCWLDSFFYLSEKNRKLQKSAQDNRCYQLFYYRGTRTMAFSICKARPNYRDCRIGRILLYSDHSALLRFGMRARFSNGRGSGNWNFKWSFTFFYFHNNTDHKFSHRIRRKIGQHNCNVRIHGFCFGWMFFIFPS